MGILADMKAMKEVERIKMGGTAQLSIASITNMIINTVDAQRSLSKQQFDQVWRVYSQMRKCTAKMTLDYEGYLRTCVDILKEFDAVAPCEYYLGLQPFEAKMLMNEVRNS